MTRDIVLTELTVADCPECDMTRGLVAELIEDNARLGIELELVDVDRDPRAVVASGAMSHPTVIVTVDGRERTRLSGAMTKRRMLRKLLPVLYPDDDDALAQLRRQLRSPAETFPGGSRLRRVRQAERVELLRSVPLFGDLTKRQLGQVARLVDEVHREPGSRLATEGERGDEFFVVVDGAVTVERRGREVARLGPGEHVGEMSLLDDEPRSATVTTAADSTLLVMHRPDFERMLTAHPPIMRAMLTTLSKRLR